MIGRLADWTRSLTFSLFNGWQRVCPLSTGAPPARRCVPAKAGDCGPPPQNVLAARAWATAELADALAEAHLGVTALGAEENPLLRGWVVLATPPGPSQPAAGAVLAA